MHSDQARGDHLGEDMSTEDLGEHLVRAAAHAFVEQDEAFFLACEARWARRFAPDGPTLRSLIEAVHDAPHSNGSASSQQPPAKRGGQPKRSSSNS
jgi:hypothetical protein